jgi:hypothetical protein
MPKQEVVEVKKNELAGVQQLTIAPSDIDIPRLNLVQKTSSIDGPVGSVVLDKTHILMEPEDSREVIVVTALKRWREDIPYGSDELPRIAENETQKEAINNNSEWGTIEFADIILLIPQPKDNEDEAAYTVPIKDSMYAIGKLNAAKDAYRMTYKRLATFCMYNPTTPFSHRKWTFTAELLTRGKHSWFAPSLTITKKEPSDDVIKFVNRLTA